MLWEKTFKPSDVQAACDALTRAWAVEENKVFVLRADGVIADVRQFYDDCFQYLGTAVPLAEDVAAGDRDNQRTGKVWMEVRYDPAYPNAYRHSANAQPLHTDGSYISMFPNATLMACVVNAGVGGETTFIDAVDLVEALQTESPDLLAQLSSRVIPHARSGDRRENRVVDISGRQPTVNWNYYCVDQGVDTEDRSLVDGFFNYLQVSPMVRDRTIAVKLNGGDAITWKDRCVLHGRNGFEASKASERFLWKCAIDIANFGG